MAKRDIETSEDIKLGKDGVPQEEPGRVSSNNPPQKESTSVKNAHASGDGSISRNDTETDDEGNTELSK
ncbi:MAG: hypothetical protein ACM3VS_03900 [Candidatus Dadabacteria bacterium]